MIRERPAAETVAGDRTMPAPRDKRPHLRALAALAAVAVTLLMAACGGGDETSVPEADSTIDLPTGTLTKSELIKTADGLCGDANDHILGQAQPPDFGRDGVQKDELTASADFWETTANESETLVNQLSQLQPPKSLEKQWSDYLDLLRAGTVDYANGLASAAQDGDVDAFYAAARAGGPKLVELDAQSQALGLRVCGKGDAS
jgi:hypothetical protein